MDVKSLDRISRAVLHRAITGARAKLNIPVSYENDPIFFEGPEFGHAMDAIGAMLLAYERHVRDRADPDACASEPIDEDDPMDEGYGEGPPRVAPQIQEQRERVARIKESMARHAESSQSPYPPKPLVWTDYHKVEVITKKTGYAHKAVVGKTSLNLNQAEVIALIEKHYDPMDFGYSGFNYNKHTGVFTINIKTD